MSQLHPLRLTHTDQSQLIFLSIWTLTQTLINYGTMHRAADLLIQLEIASKAHFLLKKLSEAKVDKD